MCSRSHATHALRLRLALVSLLGATATCNSLWGLDELRYDGSQAGSSDSSCSEDGAEQHCYDGEGFTQDVGACSSGVSTCTSGSWGACVGQVLPTTEVCGNGSDDDCDGVTDEAGGCECCTPKCTSVCAGQPDGCGRECQLGCSETQCCNGQGECKDGDSDKQCGANGASCENCLSMTETCGPAGPTLSSKPQMCLPPCSGHLRALNVGSAALGGGRWRQHPMC